MRVYQVLREREARELAASLSGWRQGNARTPALTGTVKQNEEILDHPDLAEIGKRIVNNGSVQVDHLPLKCSPPKFSRYCNGGQYHPHTDAPWMGDTRTDLSCTLWLSDDYEGGELVIDGRSVKGKPGQALIYPCGEVHRVMPVTSGERIAVITWIQSRVRDLHKRTIVSDMRKLLSTLEGQQYLELTRLYSALLRMWAE